LATRIGLYFWGWFDNSIHEARREDADDKVDWARIVPFILLHIACFSVIWVGYSVTAVAVAVFLYLFRVFSITAFYHRYFSHKAFKTSRIAQFIFAVCGLTAVQRGPIWWASHHREHHRYSDQPQDVHSPVQHAFIRSHMLWFLTKKHFFYNPDVVKDLRRFPELRFLDRFDVIIPLLMFGILYGIGQWLAAHAPQLHTNGWQLLVWGGIISTVFMLHATFSINSLAHRLGRRRYKTNDHSRNSFLLAIVTGGEGWHNNHHFYPVSARLGFFWWQFDPTYYILKVLEKLGIIWHLKIVPNHLRDKR